MRVRLLPHAANPFAGAVSVDIQCVGSDLQLIWEMHAHEPLVRPPTMGERGQRRDGLWRHTCGELFALDPQCPGPYLEFNFSPADAWAAYRFDGPRRGMRAHDWGGAPLIMTEPLSAHEATTGDGLRLRVTLSLQACGSCLAFAPTAVLETAAGHGYFALRHPAGAPDFHGGAAGEGNLAAALELTTTRGRDGGCQ